MRFLQLLLTRLELTYPLKLLKSQGKRLDYLERSVKERNGAIKEPRRQKEGTLRQDRDTPAFIHIALRTGRRISVRSSKLGYSPVVRDIRRFVKLGFHALFRNLNYRHGGSRRRKNWISASMLCITFIVARIAIAYGIE